jgi:Arc/MetJ family transcription regulator
MRTTVELDDALVEEARLYLGAGSLRGMIEHGLREAIRARKRQALQEAIRSGSLELAIAEEDLRRLRRDKPW